MDPMEVDSAQVSQVDQFFLNFPQHPNEVINWIARIPTLSIPIQDQGKCGCCWALVCAYAMSLWLTIQVLVTRAVLTYQPVSAQELLNRVISHYPFHHYNLQDIDEMGCYPSNPILGFAFARDKGLPSESMLPFVHHRMTTSFYIGEHEYPRIKISGYKSLGDWVNPQHRSGICSAFKGTQLVACIDVTERFEQFDGEGIFEALPCEKIVGKHAIIVVVFNPVDDYFIIRNTWSPLWAKGGFCKVRCNQLYNFSRPIGKMSFMPNSQTTFPIDIEGR